MNISNKEFDAIMKLEPFDRYKYHIKKFADSEIMFSLQNAQKEIAIAEVENKLMISFWPAREFALSLAKGPWINYSECEITLNLFKKKFIPEIKKKSIYLTFFHYLIKLVSLLILMSL